MKKFYSVILGALLALASPFLWAVPPDFTTLTASVDYSTATAAIMTVFGALGVVYIVLAGGKMILRQMKGG